VTVLFCDIRGFTPLTEGMDPARVIDLLNEHMTALTKVVHNHGGVVDKFVGDLLMALFGAPHSYGDDTLRAVRCALGMIAERQRMNLGGGRVLEVGIGLARGQVVAGCMGSATRLNYTVLGERVNLASRLCSAALAGEVLADEAVAAAVAGQVGVAAREPMRLKGFASPVAVYALLAGGDQEAGSSSTVSSR
jgi:class 3 adenylate cyclase